VLGMVAARPSSRASVVVRPHLSHPTILNAHEPDKASAARGRVTIANGSTDHGDQFSVAQDRIDAKSKIRLSGSDGFDRAAHTLGSDDLGMSVVNPIGTEHIIGDRKSPPFHISKYRATTCLDTQRRLCPHVASSRRSLCPVDAALIPPAGEPARNAAPADRRP
jgi:hypothetical protein